MTNSGAVDGVASLLLYLGMQIIFTCFKFSTGSQCKIYISNFRVQNNSQALGNFLLISTVNWERFVRLNICIFHFSRFSRVLRKFSREYKCLSLIVLNNKDF